MERRGSRGPPSPHPSVASSSAMELPYDEIQRGEKLKQMVEKANLNEVLQSAVNAAFDANSTDLVAFIGQYLVERMDSVPCIDRIVPRSVMAMDGTNGLEIEVFCKVNGVVKVQLYFEIMQFCPSDTR